jgi:hypothetical protein
MTIETVTDLIVVLEAFPDETPVMLATQPPWPFKHALATVQQAPDGTVYLAEGTQIGYLPDPVRRLLGW